MSKHYGFENSYLQQHFLSKVTRCLYYLFNIWPLTTMNFAQEYKKLTKVGLIFCQILAKIAKDCWNFAQSGHTESAPNIFSSKFPNRLNLRLSKIKFLLLPTLQLLPISKTRNFAGKWNQAKELAPLFYQKYSKYCFRWILTLNLLTRHFGFVFSEQNRIKQQ